MCRNDNKYSNEEEYLAIYSPLPPAGSSFLFPSLSVFYSVYRLVFSQLTINSNLCFPPPFLLYSSLVSRHVV